VRYQQLPPGQSHCAQLLPAGNPILDELSHKNGREIDLTQRAKHVTGKGSPIEQCVAGIPSFFLSLHACDVGKNSDRLMP
jgi:hypothetical protein